MHKIADGLWQLTGRPRNLINAYLVKNVLIDAGTRWARGRIVGQLQNRPMRMVALTHCHPDHQGAARAVCERFGVPLACHAGDVPAMEGKAAMLPRNRLLRWGQRLMAGPPYPVGRVLRAGDDVAGFRVIHAPGHTPGHVMFFRPADRVAIVGDVLVNIHFLTLKPGLIEPPPFFSADFVENRRSILKLIALEPRLVCFGHGPPLRGPDELYRFLAIRKHWLGKL